MKVSESQGKRILAVFGIFYGLIVALTHQDYGINLDEPLHVEYGKSVVNWYLSGFSERDIFSYTNLWLYGGLYDTINYLVTSLSPYDLYHTRHLLSATTGFVGVIGVFYLTQHISSSARAGLIAAGMLLLIPRYYGHAMFNHKDIPFAVGYVWSLYLILKSLDEFPKVSGRTAVLTGVAVGATVGIRIAGVILALYYLLAVVSFARPFRRNFDWQSAVRSVLVSGTVAYALMIVCWPWVHANPITRPLRALMMIADFPFSITTLFEGQVYDSANIPWYYAPKWLLIAVPEFLLMGVALALGPVVISLIQRRPGTRHRLTVYVAFAALFPVLYVVLSGAPLYNGLRHTLFVIPPLCAVSAAAIDKLLDHRTVLARVATALIAASALVTSIDMIRLHPNQYVFFNHLLAGGLSSAAPLYDTDYFANSHRLGIRWIDEQLKTGTSVTVNVPIAEVASGTSVHNRTIPWRADYLLVGATRDEDMEVPGEIVHTIRAADVPLLDIVSADPEWRGQPFYHGPNAEFHYAGLATSHALLGNVAEARDLYRKAIERRPERRIWHYKLGRLLMDQDLLAEAIESFEKAIELRPTYRAHFHLASCYHRTDRYQKAVVNYKRSLEMRFDSEWAYLNLGGSLSALGHFPEAEYSYKQALYFNPGVVDAKERLAQLYFKQARYDEALPLLDQLETESSDLLESVFFKASIHYERGEIREAVGYLRRIVEEADRADAYLLLSKCLRQGGEIEEAYVSVTRLLELAPDEDPAWAEYLSVGETYHEAGNLERAELIYRAYLERTPESDRVWQNLAILLFGDDRFDNAFTAFANAARANPSSVEALLGLGQSAERLARIDAAKQSYRSALQLVPDHAIALEKLANLTRNQQ